MKLKRLGHVLGMTMAGMALLTGGVAITMMQDGGGGGEGGGGEPASEVPGLLRVPGIVEAAIVSGIEAGAISAVATAIEEDADAYADARADRLVVEGEIGELRDDARRFGMTTAGRSAITQRESTLAGLHDAEATASAAFASELQNELASRVGSQGAAMAARQWLNRDRVVPAAFRVLDLSGEQWEVLETAWAAHEVGMEVGGAGQTLLSLADSSQDVALATSRLQDSTRNAQIQGALGGLLPSDP